VRENMQKRIGKELTDIRGRFREGERRTQKTVIIQLTLCENVSQ
jgi:hypothetical protein